MTKVNIPWKAIRLVAAGLFGGAIGFVVRGLLPPFVVDDPFWRAFWTGPPVAGLFAVIAATIAFYPAYRSSRIARENAAREQWWDRAKWALELATSDDQTDREVANDTLVALQHEATESEGAIIIRTIENLQGEQRVDRAAEPAEDGDETGGGEHG